MRRRPRSVLLLAFTLLLAPALAAQEFLEQAQSLKAASNWAELAKLAAARLAEDDEDCAARAFLAVALAGQQQFDAAVGELVALRDAGLDPCNSLGAFGVPFNEVLNTTYSHCWANWSPEFNRRAWSALFAAFPATPNSGVPASRLLMAALKLEDAVETHRLEAWFDARLAAAAGNTAAERPVLTYYCQAYVRAGVGGDKTLDLAARTYDIAWAEAARAHRYGGPDDPAGDDLGRREECDIDCDDEFNNLALACCLTGVLDSDRNPLTAREPEPGAVFDDVTEQVGLGGQKHGRVAVGDYDGDGDPDVCFSGVLFRNEKGGSFVNVTKDAGLGQRGTSALFGDYDGDGDLDLLLPAAPHPFLYRNGGKRANFVFEDVTEPAGLKALTVEAPPEGAAWLDVDGDGYLEFYLAVYEEPMSAGHPDVLVRNDGKGKFSDVSEAAGIHGVPVKCGRGVAAADYDADGDTDMYVSNYRLNVNYLFRNDGHGVLSDVAPALGVHGEPDRREGQYFGHTIGSAWGDIDNDGDLDLFSANLAHPRFIRQGFSNLSMLYLNSGEPGGYTFAEARRARGIRFQETHSDPAFADIDNDGDLDLSITCVYEGVPSALFQNDGTGHFQPVTFRSRAIAFNGWGQAWFDYDGDGDLDVLFGSGSGVRLFRNRGNKNGWLAVKLVGRRGDRFGIGARVTVEAIDDGLRRCWTRELNAGRGTTSQDGETLHFGLGDFRGKVRVAVRWPDTGSTERKAFFINRVVTFRQMK